LLLGLAQRGVQQEKEPQIQLRVHFELAVFLQNRQQIQLSEEDKVVLVGQDQNVCDGNYAVLQALCVQFIQKLRSWRFLTCGLDGNAVLGIVWLVVVEVADGVVEHLQNAVNVLLLQLCPVERLVLGDFEDRRGQQVLDGNLGLLDDVAQAVEHVGKRVVVAVLQQLLQENVEALVAEQVGVEGGDFGGLEQRGAERLHDEDVFVEAEHLDEEVDDVVVVEQVVEQVELGEEVDHVNDVKKDLKHKRVVLLREVRFQERNRGVENMSVLFVSVEKCVIVRLLYDQENNLHEVEEAKVFFCLLISQENKLHDVLNMVFVRDLLDVLQMSQNFD
jgi:hypothetical protein